MATRMCIYQPGDQLATLSAEGECRVWIVGVDGLIGLQPLYAPPTTPTKCKQDGGVLCSSGVDCECKRAPTEGGAPTPPPTTPQGTDGSDTQ